MALSENFSLLKSEFIYLTLFFEMAGTYGLNFVKLSYAMLSVSIALIFSFFFVCVCIS